MNVEQKTAALIQSHQVRLARAVVRQIHLLVPKYRLVDAQAMEKNVLAQLQGVVVILERGDERKLLSVVEPLVQIRSMSGFDISEFLLAYLCFLPVTRRFFMERLPLGEALASYEVVENLALPLLGRFMALFHAAAAENAQPPRPHTAFFTELPLQPLSVERVTGGDEEESTIRDFRPPG
jgi:hypothetical protein